MELCDKPAPLRRVPSLRTDDHDHEAILMFRGGVEMNKNHPRHSGAGGMGRLSQCVDERRLPNVNSAEHPSGCLRFHPPCLSIPRFL